MTIIIEDVLRPEILIQFRVDIGNGSVGAESNYARVGYNGVIDLYRWEVGGLGNLDVIDDGTGTPGTLQVQPGGVIVVDPLNPPPPGEDGFLYIVDISTQDLVANPTPPFTVVPQPGQPQQPGDGLVHV